MFVILLCFRQDFSETQFLGRNISLYMYILASLPLFIYIYIYIVVCVYVGENETLKNASEYRHNIVEDLQDGFL